MRTPSVLVTGTSGEIGHGLIHQLARTGRSIVTIDIAPLEPALARQVRREFTGSITDKWILERVLAEFEVDLVFHDPETPATTQFAQIRTRRCGAGGRG